MIAQILSRARPPRFFDNWGLTSHRVKITQNKTTKTRTTICSPQPENSHITLFVGLLGMLRVHAPPTLSAPLYFVQSPFSTTHAIGKRGNPNHIYTSVTTLRAPARSRIYSQQIKLTHRAPSGGVPTNESPAKTRWWSPLDLLRYHPSRF